MWLTWACWSPSRSCRLTSRDCWGRSPGEGGPTPRRCQYIPTSLGLDMIITQVVNQQNRGEGICQCSLFISCYCWQNTLASQLMDSIKHQSWLKYLSSDIALVQCVDILLGWKNWINFLWSVIRFKIHWANNCIPQLNKEFAKVTNQKLILNFKVNLHPRTKL